MGDEDGTEYYYITEERLVGDILRLKQILINLLNNAIKFTPEEGRVTLEMHRLVTRNTSVRMRFTVIDIGIGIDSEFTPHLFDQFEQSGKSPKIYLKKLPELRVLVADDDRDCCEHAL